MLFPLLLLASLACAKAKEPADVSLLSWKDYREKVMQLPLIEAALADSTQSEGMRGLMRASLYYKESKWDSALALYRKHQKAMPIVEGQVLMRMGRCALELGHPDSSRAILLSLPSLLKNRPWWEQADRIIAEGILRDTSISDSARLDSMQVRLKAKPSDDYRPWLQLKCGLLHEALGQYEKAQAIYVEVLHDKDYRGSALDAITALKPKIGYPKATWPLAETVLKICKANENRECIAWTDSLLVRPDLERRTRVALLMAKSQAFQGIDKLDSAAMGYRWLLDSVEKRPVWMQSLSRILRKQKNRAEAERIDSLFHKEFPFSPENANSIWVQALELEQDSQMVQSYLKYASLNDPRFGRNQRRQWAPFRMGFIWFKMGLYEDAIHAFEGTSHDDEFAWPQVASQFFEGECYQRLGKKAEAKAAFVATAKAFPLSWYAHRARIKLLEYKLLDSASIPWIKVLETTPEQSLAWVRKHMPRNKRTEKGTEERIHLVETLNKLGFDDEADRVFAKSVNAFGTRADFLLQAGQMFSRMGETGEAFRMARLLLEVVDRRWLSEMPRSVAELLYPLPKEWRETASQYAKDPIDPYFTFAVMRQESIFVPDISSPVGARGLMQIMPKTGKVLARAEGVRGYRDELLFNPIMAIHLGSRYLRDLVKDFKGDPMYALANYNAGPAPAKRWQAAHAKLGVELRAEEISFWETREYVKKVLGNWWSYQAIYGKGPMVVHFSVAPGDTIGMDSLSDSVMGKGSEGSGDSSPNGGR